MNHDDNNEIREETNKDRNYVKVEMATLLDVDQKQLTASIEAKMKSLPSPKCCIHRVPQEFRHGKEDKFVPQTLSIGPFHHGKPHLKAMEDHKKGYLQALLIRSAGTTKLEELVKAIWNMESDARKCYGELLNHLSTKEFVEMILLDGCFILEFLYRYMEENMSYHDQAINKYDDDRMFIANWLIPSCRQDMILLENQLPFSVLETLHNLTNYPDSLTKLVTFFFTSIFPMKTKFKMSSESKVFHLLDFLRSHLFPKSPVVREVKEIPLALEFTKCATNLSEAGVKFRRNTKAEGLLDITFNENGGVFEIPQFLFGRSMPVLLSNLIAFEQCQGYDDRVSSYAVLLDNLINSPNDVKLLRDKGIINCLFYEDERVSTIINNICKGVFFNYFYYQGLCHEVNNYCRKRRHRWRAALLRDYFNSPWAIISVIAATILLLLTAAQTVASFL